MRENETALREAGAAIAVIGLADAERARTFREETRATFPLLVDLKREAYRAVGLGVARPLDLLRPSLWLAILRSRRAGFRQGAVGKDPFQLGGAFAFGAGDRDLFAHVNRSFSDDAPMQELLAAVKR